MALPSDLMTGLVDRLTAAQQPGGSLANASKATIIREDALDIATQIQKTANQFGMIWLIGQVPFENRSTMQNTTVEAIVKTSIAIREDPTIWRTPNDAGNTNLVAQDIAFIMVQLLHGYVIPGFRYLKAPRAVFVPNKKVQLFEIPIETLLLAPTLPV